MIFDIKFRKNKDAVYRVIDSQAVILTTEDSFLHTLNEVGTFVWELLNGKNTVKDIVVKVYEEFDVDEKKAEQDVKHFIEDLLRRKLISAKK